MKRIVTLFLVMMALSAYSLVNIPKQEIHYNVNYHWGLINVMIAKGVVTIETNGEQFHGTLDGTSIPWEGHVICVSDTLKAMMTPTQGLSHETVTYQNGWYRRPKVSYFHSANYNPDDPASYKNTKGEGEYNASNDSMEAITVTTDMLGIYYYAHEMDFESMDPGQSVTLSIDGGLSDKVIITYNGKGTYSDNVNTYRTYDIMFEYAYQGQMSGYKVQSKIGAESRIPMFISASLPVGHVEMLYVEP